MAGAVASAEEKVYVPYSGILSGTEGTDALHLSVANGTGAEMACTAALAHWYSADLGQAAPGGSVDVALRHDPETGVIALLNATEDRMPVEAIWCGTAGRMTATRTRIELPFATGPAPATLLRTCRAGPGDRLDCEAKDG